MLAGAACALVIGAFVCLTRGFYFIMVTLAAAQMMYSLFHDTDIAKGSDGAYVNVKPDLVIGATTLLDFDDRKTFYYVCLALLVVTVLALFALARTPFGRIVQGLKANETRLSALGYNTYQFKLAAFVVAGAFAGSCRRLVRLHRRLRHAGPLLLAPVGPRHHDGRVLGGAGTLFGPILGVLAYVSLEETLKTASLVGAFVADHWRLGTGATLVVAVLLSPDGLAGFLRGKPRPRERRAAEGRRAAERAAQGARARHARSLEDPSAACAPSTA
ncbi:MAG: branched-chain amino acid ABC transporter permease [Rhodoblastus sp.]